MKKKIAVGIGCFCLSLVVFFPYYGIRNRLFNEISKRTGMELFAGAMWPTFSGPGVRIKEVVLQFPSMAANNQNLDIELDAVELYLPWMSLFQFSPLVTLNSELARDGLVSVSISPGTQRLGVTAMVRDIKIKPYLTQLGFTSVDFSGDVDMDVKSTVDIKAESLGASDLILHVKKLALGELEYSGFKIPQLEFASPVVIKAASKDGKTFDLNATVGQAGELLEFTLTGTLNLNAKQPDQSAFELKNTLKLSPALAQQESVSMVLPLLEQFKKPDGTYNIQLSGTLGTGVTTFPTTF